MRQFDSTDVCRQGWYRRHRAPPSRRRSQSQSPLPTPLRHRTARLPGIRGLAKHSCPSAGLSRRHERPGHQGHHRVNGGGSAGLPGSVKLLLGRARMSKSRARRRNAAPVSIKLLVLAPHSTSAYLRRAALTSIVGTRMANAVNAIIRGGPSRRCPAAAPTVDVDAVVSNGSSALFCASLEGKVEIIELLIAHGAEVNRRNGEGRTTLHWSSQNGHIEVAKVLLAHAADLEPVDSDEALPLHWAEAEGHEDMMEFFMSPESAK